VIALGDDSGPTNPPQSRSPLTLKEVKMTALPKTTTLILVGLLAAGQLTAREENPPAPGFDAAGSDTRAIEIADAVMTAMGGRDAWDATRYLSWNFFGRRTHVWDRWTGDLRFEQGDQLVLTNIHDKSGRAWEGGEEVTDPAERERLLENTYRAWINDSYWLLMPYKLKDSGVTLELAGEGELPDGRPAWILQLTFEDVGVTPQNKYDVYVAKDTELVEQWSFYPTVDQEEPAFTTPWANWQKHGAILLSGDRGELRGNPAQLTDVRVFDSLPEAVFESPAEVDLDALPEAPMN
jgi:hypothetical protein